MKKNLFLSLLLVAVLFTITGCGENKNEDNKNNINDNEYSEGAHSNSTNNIIKICEDNGLKVMSNIDQGDEQKPRTVCRMMDENNKLVIMMSIDEYYEKTVAKEHFDEYADIGFNVEKVNDDIYIARNDIGNNMINYMKLDNNLLISISTTDYTSEQKYINITKSIINDIQ